MIIEHADALKKFFFNPRFFVQYGAAIINGLASLFCLTILGRVYPSSEQYSAIANIVTLFTAYFVYLDLGYTTEMMRDLRVEHEDPNPPSSEHVSNAFLNLLWLRVAVVALLVPAALAQGLFSGTDNSAILGFGLFALSMIFFAFHATLDSLHLAEGQTSRAVFVKLVRTLVSVLFPLVLAIRKPNHLGIIFLIYFGISFFVCSLTAWTQRKTLTRIFARGYLPHWSSFKEFGRRCLKIGATPLTALTGSFIVQTALFRGQGLDKLATYVAAISLMSPVTTAMQTISQIVLKGIGDRAVQSPQLAWRHVWKSSLLVAFVGVTGFASILACYAAGVVDLVLKHLDSSFLPIFCLAASAQLLASFQVQFFNFLQFQKRYRALFWGSTIVSLVTTLGVASASLRFGVWGNLWGGVLGNFALLSTVAIIARHEGTRPMSQN